MFIFLGVVRPGHSFSALVANEGRLSCEIFNVLAHQLLYRFYNIDLNQFIDFTQLASRLHLSSFPHPGRSVYHVIDSDFISILCIQRILIYQGLAQSLEEMLGIVLVQG